MVTTGRGEEDSQIRWVGISPEEHPFGGDTWM